MKVLIVGSGRMGAGLAKCLVDRHHSVTIVDKDPLAFENLDNTFKGKKVLGIGFDRDVLLNAGIESVDGVAAVTSSDEANVVISRIAKDIFHVPNVVARLYDIRLTEVYKSLGLQTVAPIGWGVNQVADMILYAPLETVPQNGSEDVKQLETEVPQPLIGRAVKDLTVTGEIHIVTITRADKTFLPTLETIFQKEDLLHLAVSKNSTNRLRKLLSN